MAKYYVFFVILSMIVVSTIIVGFQYAGDPFTEQQVKLDEARLQDLNNLRSQVENYYQKNSVLPSSLNQIQKPNYLRTTDPKSNKEYEYKVNSERSFSFCTEFATDTQSKDSISNTMYSYNNTAHKKGYDCVSYTIPDYIKPVSVSSQECQQYTSPSTCSPTGGATDPCAWYFCSNSCWTRGTSNCEAGCSNYCLSPTPTMNTESFTPVADYATYQNPTANISGELQGKINQPITFTANFFDNDGDLIEGSVYFAEATASGRQEQVTLINKTVLKGSTDKINTQQWFTTPGKYWVFTRAVDTKGHICLGNPSYTLKDLYTAEMTSCGKYSYLTVEIN